MKNISLVLGFILLVTGMIYAQNPPDTLWTRTFGGSDNDDARSIQQTSDSGYILAGYTESFGTGNGDFWLIKTDENGNEEWNQTFDGSLHAVAYSVQQTIDNGFIVAGMRYSNGVPWEDVWLIKTDENGNEEWNQTFGGDNQEYAISVQQTSDLGYIITGWTKTFGAGEEDFWLIKTDVNGNEEWNHTFGGSDKDLAWSVQQTSDNGFIIVGYTNSFGSGSSDVWLIKTDENGNLEWDQTFGGIESDRAYSVQQTSDDGFILAGYTSSFGNGSHDFWLIKTDEYGNLQWEQTFGGINADTGLSVQQTLDSGYILTGYTESYGSGQTDIWVIKTDSSGNLIWQKLFGGTFIENESRVIQTTDSGYLVSGSTYSYGAGGCDVWLIRIAPESNVIINIPDDYPTIQEGIDAASNGDTVLVQPGTYVENINFNGKNITVGSLFLTTQDNSYISQTIIDGNQNGSVVTFESGEDSTAILSGFTLTNGCFGISIWNNSNPIIKHVYIINNSENGVYCSYSNPTITNALIRGNTAYAGGGGLDLDHSNPIILNVVICNNIANMHGGGGLYCAYSNPTLINVTISGNSSQGSAIGGGIYCLYSSPTLVNCILWGNSSPEIYIAEGSVSVSYSDIQGGWEGEGNIDSDPLFVDPDNGDYHLSWINFPIQDSTKSPCIDAGDPSSPFDPDGTIADMGAFYFDQTQNYFDISGNIGYFSDGDAVPNVILDLTGDNNYSTTTDENGDYFLLDIPGGNYVSTPSKIDDLDGLSGLDASRIARFSAGLYEFDCLEMIAGDVSMNGSISGTDASRVARYSVGSITELNDDDINWVFTPEPIPECEDWPPIVYESTIEYSPLNSDLTDEDFIGIRLGDVSGNWSPDMRKPITYESSEITEIETNINSTLKIPIVIEEATQIEGIDICISFDSEVLHLAELTLNEGILDNKDYAIEKNLEESGQGIMVIYAQKDLVSEAGAVAFIEFVVIGEVGSKSEVYFTKFDVNETAASGGLQILDTEGKEITTQRLEVNVVQPIPDKFALYQNYPNPFTSKTVIRYDLPKDTHVNIQIYNVRGQLVKELVNGIETAGRKKIEWDTEGMSSGIYFYRLSTKDKNFIRKMIIIKR